MQSELGVEADHGRWSLQTPKYHLRHLTFTRPLPSLAEQKIHAPPTRSKSFFRLNSGTCATSRATCITTCTHILPGSATSNASAPSASSSTRRWMPVVVVAVANFFGVLAHDKVYRIASFDVRFRIWELALSRMVMCNDALANR